MEKEPIRNVYSLLLKDIAELPAIHAIQMEFQKRIPSRFGNVRVLIPPYDIPGIEIAIRADCQNPGCGVRAVSHIRRVKDGQWFFIEEKPLFDRTDRSPCSDCQKELCK